MFKRRFSEKWQKFSATIRSELQHSVIWTRWNIWSVSWRKVWGFIHQCQTSAGRWMRILKSVSFFFSLGMKSLKQNFPRSFPERNLCYIAGTFVSPSSWISISLPNTFSLLISRGLQNTERFVCSTSNLFYSSRWKVSSTIHRENALTHELRFYFISFSLPSAFHAIQIL